jgi:hypothetical protein
MADEPLAVPESSGLANNEVDDRQSYFTQGASGQDFTGADEYPPPPVVTDPEDFIYNADQPPDLKFRALGWRLSQFGDLFRHPDHGSGLLLVVRGGKPRAVPVMTNSELLAVVNDRLRITVVADGKPKGGRIPPAELGSMLKSEVFLQQFRPLDRVIEHPQYLPSWAPSRPGYNDGGRGLRYYFAGGEGPVYTQPEMIRLFLSVIPFKTDADRTNTVAAALTVLLRNLWPGEKPMFPVTANRSHAGKGTVVAFIRGHCVAEQVTYEGTDWAFRKSVAILFQLRPDLDLINIDNIRLDRKGEVIKSGFLEQLLHDPEPVLSASGVNGLRVHNHFVVAATANEGRFSEDLVNRSVPIRLEVTGDLANRKSPIGDPKNDFLPRNRDRIVGELRGMIERWKAVGCPLDENAKHPSFSGWAKTIGGILRVNEFPSFLANQTERRSEDDPVRRGLAQLGAFYPSVWSTSADWAARIAKLGLTKLLIPVADQDTSDGRARWAGVVLSNHAGETLTTETEDEMISLVLSKARRRFDGGEPQTRYRFEVTARCPVQLDEGE